MPKAASTEDMVFDDEDLEVEGKEGNKKGKTIGALIAVFIVVVWIAIFALLIKLDVGGFGSNVLAPILSDVPVINKILPASAEGELISDNGVTYKTLQEAIDRINELENEVEIYSNNANENAETISNLTAEISRLQEYEDNQTAFEALRKQFDEEVVYTKNAPDIDNYRTWYEQMYPENAEEIFRQVTEQLEVEAVIQNLANYYSSMDASSAASIFEEMTGDLEKVAQILTCMKNDQAGEILAQMDTTLAAQLTLLIYPVTE